jgi:hypothetical protein
MIRAGILRFICAGGVLMVRLRGRRSRVVLVFGVFLRGVWLSLGAARAAVVTCVTRVVVDDSLVVGIVDVRDIHARE